LETGEAPTSDVLVGGAAAGDVGMPAGMEDDEAGAELTETAGTGGAGVGGEAGEETEELLFALHPAAEEAVEVDDAVVVGPLDATDAEEGA